MRTNTKTITKNNRKNLAKNHNFFLLCILCKFCLLNTNYTVIITGSEIELNLEGVVEKNEEEKIEMPKVIISLNENIIYNEVDTAQVPPELELENSDNISENVKNSTSDPNGSLDDILDISNNTDTGNLIIINLLYKLIILIQDCKIIYYCKLYINYILM